MPRRRKAGPGAPEKILVVDPLEERLEAQATSLREDGFRVVTLARFEAAVPLFEVFRPDAVLLCCRAPDELTIAIARRLRTLSAGTVPIFFLVDDCTSEVRVSCLEKGMAVDVLPRDLEARELNARLHAQLKLKHALARAVKSDAEVQTPVLHDPLTGAHTRRHLLSLIAQEVRRCERYGGTFSVLSCEVDGYQSFRRNFGKEMAERLLVYASVVLSQTLREADVVARVDEASFSVLLPNTPAENVEALVTRVRKRFELARFHVDGKALSAQVSLGTSSFPDRVGTASQLLNAAFEALRRGRQQNRTTGMSPAAL